MTVDRRTFLQIAGAGAFTATFRATINKALAYTGSMNLNGQNANIEGTGSLQVNGPFTVNSGGGGSKISLPLVTVPAGALKPGSYQVTVLGQRGSKAWTVQVH